MSRVIHIKCDDDMIDFLNEVDEPEFEEDLREKIEDVDKFKRELERAGFMTRNLDEFIENYLRFDNN